MSEIQTANCMFWILVLSKSSVVWLLHKLKSDYTQGDLFDWCVFKGDNCFRSVKCQGLSKTLTLGFTQTRSTKFGQRQIVHDHGT